MQEKFRGGLSQKDHVSLFTAGSRDLAELLGIRDSNLWHIGAHYLREIESHPSKPSEDGSSKRFTSLCFPTLSDKEITCDGFDPA